MTEIGLPLEKALEVASKISNPYALTAFALVLLTAIGLPQARKTSFAYVLLIAIFILALTPWFSRIYLTKWGIYHVRIVVLGQDGQPDSQAALSTMTGGDLKRDNQNWEFDIPPQSKPSDGRVTFFASVDDAYLSGSSTLQLGSEFYPTVTIPLTAKPTVMMRGVVIDEKGKSVSGAKVSIVGYPQVATTNQAGNFYLASHHSDGQLTTIRAEKGARSTQTSVIAGEEVELVLETHQ